ncbi:YraN family protein [Pseudonocardia lacus]|uniref:YraN family protein n=1 Tax=Pseudonocardia lacus TaxID=2835865 RepID=UPI001BDBBF32|nr:YraN family protein [Pseudonocardia lacus]
MAAKDVLGRRGEDLAAHHLQQQGLVILSRNWRCRDGELDLVATDRSQLVVVCEVKTRSAARFGSPAEAVTRAKANRIRRVTQVWLAAHQVRWVRLRFDVVAVLAEPGHPVEITHYRGAF